MKDPTNVAVAEPRQRIHAAALRLFARDGYDGVSLQDIADEVGLHKSSLFHHYASKLELVRDVLEAALERVVSEVAPLESGPLQLEVFLGVADALVDHFSEEPDAARLFLMLMTQPATSPLRIALTDDAHPVVRFYSTVWNWLDRAKKTGAIRPVNLRQTMLNLMGLMLFYPAVAPTDVIAGPSPFSPKARATRKRELRFAITGMLAP